MAGTTADESSVTLVGIDHGFSFPARYFEQYGLSGNWIQFLEDFKTHWPTDEKDTYVDFRAGWQSGKRASTLG